MKFNPLERLIAQQQRQAPGIGGRSANEAPVRPRPRGDVRQADPLADPFPTVWLTGTQSVAAATLDPFAWDSVWATAGSVAASPPGTPFAWDDSDPTNLYLAGEFWFLATLYVAFASDAAGYRKVDLNGFLDTRLAVNGAPTELTMAQQWPCETSQTVDVTMYHTGGGALDVTAHLMVTAFPTASPPYEQIYP